MSINLTRVAAHLILVISVLTLAGCGSDMADLSRYVNEVKQRPADPIELIPPVATYTPHIYSSSSERNPFLPTTTDDAVETVEGLETEGPKPDPNRTKEYLEQYSLDTLTLVGNLSKDGTDWSLVRDPDGVIHRVASGNYLGKNHGHVTAVHPGRMELSELIPTGSGGWRLRDTAMALDDS